MNFALDTSFLISAFRYKIDITSELQKFGRPYLYTLDLVVSELQHLLKKGTRKNARLSLDFLSSGKVDILHADTDIADNELELLAASGFVICTVDKKLLQRLKGQGRKTVIIRQKKHLEMM